MLGNGCGGIVYGRRRGAYTRSREAEIALRIGVPDDVIAATMVAFGTSLPELVTALASIRKGHLDIIVGNIIGADVLNCLFVIGAAAAVRPLSIPPPTSSFFTFPLCSLSSTHSEHLSL